jgi:hypothetical protein
VVIAHDKKSAFGATRDHWKQELQSMPRGAKTLQSDPLVIGQTGLVLTTNASTLEDS